MDYLTKWIEAEALANITPTNVLKLFKHYVLARFWVPKAIVTNNGT